MRKSIKQRREEIIQKKVPEGYKNDQGHIIPEHWQLCSFKSKFTRLTSKNPENLNNVLTISAKLGLIDQEEYFNHSYASEDKSNYQTLRNGDFSYNKSYSSDYPYGAIKRLDKYEKGIVSPLYICFRPERATISDYYINYFEAGLFNREIYNIAQEGARNHGLLNIQVEDFFSTPLLNPPTVEQRRIAEILNLFDEIIALKQQLIEQERKRKRWMLINLLDPQKGIRLSNVSSKWKKVAMGDLFSFGTSLAASRSDLGNSGVCYLHYGDIHSNDTAVIDVDKDYDSIPKIDLSNTKIESLQNGDIVFVDASEDYSGVSKYVVVINPRNIHFLPGLHTIPAKSKTNQLDIDFKKYCFQSPSFKKQAAFYASGMKVYGLSKRNLARIMISFPEIPEQKAISQKLISQDLMIALYMQEVHYRQLQKKSLMQLLLTGIVRVSD